MVVKQAACILVTRTHEHKEQVLLVTHKNSNGGAILPGGKVDPGETSWQAAKRELEEETGLRAYSPSMKRIMEMPVVFEGLYPKADILWWTSFFVVESWSGDISDSGFNKEGQRVWWGTWEEVFAGPYGQNIRELKARIYGI